MVNRKFEITYIQNKKYDPMKNIIVIEAKNQIAAIILTMQQFGKKIRITSVKEITE